MADLFENMQNDMDTWQEMWKYGEDTEDFADSFCNEMKSLVDGLADTFDDEAIAMFGTEMMGTCRCVVNVAIGAGKKAFRMDFVLKLGCFLAQKLTFELLVLPRCSLY